MRNLPVHIGILWPTRETAINCPMGDIELSLCLSCGFTTNDLFQTDHPDYREEYDNSLHFSTTYQDYALSQVNRLIETYEIKDKTVLEIGCGKGDFLRMLCSRGGNRGIGFDPSFEDDRGSAGDIDITFIKDLYSEKYSDHAADFYCSRYVLEHIPQPMSFLKMIHGSMDKDRQSIIYTEVPNGLLILKDLSIWDIIYEHYSYFTIDSLYWAMRSAGFDILTSGESFSGQFIYIDGQYSDQKMDHNQMSYRDGSDYPRMEHIFRDKCQDVLDSWRRAVDQSKRESKKIVVWGAGAKGVSFLNMLNLKDEIECIVDINPHKEGKHIPGSGHSIRSPSSLNQIRPDVVMIMNPVYREEIEFSLKDLGLTPEIMTVLDAH